MAVLRQNFSGMRGIATVPTYLVMQPTTLCNLDCSYCYLPARAADRRMPVGVAEAVAGPVNDWAARRRFSVVWHGGEPLAAGREHLATLLAPFAPAVEHHVQTNATLIDEAWCDFFAEHRIRVSVSVDGPRERNRLRELELPQTLAAREEERTPLLRMRLEAAIDGLPEGMRRVLVLHDVEGYTHEEIGELLGIAAGTCKSQLFKARAKLRARLRQTVEGEEVCSI